MSDLKLTTIYLNTFENFVSSVLLQPVTWIEISRKIFPVLTEFGNRKFWRWSFLERGQFRFFLCSLCLDFLVGRLSIRFVAQIQSRVVVPYLWLCIFLVRERIEELKNMAKDFCFTIPLFFNVVVDSSRSCRHFSFLNKFECFSWQIQRFWSARHNLDSWLNAKVSCLFRKHL